MICKLSEIAEINPKESLPKGIIARKIAMDILQPFCRDIHGYTYEEYSGGTKFRNDDTIMARITPCLENGKTAQVRILNDNEIAFGSTEYIVFRAKQGVSNPDFLYYLVSSQIVREPAIKSMVGSSGRQRVQTDVVANLEIDLPKLSVQCRIASILSALDEKIEVNNKINDNLVQQLQAIYQEMYGKPGQINGTLADLCCYTKSRISVSALSCSNYYSTENMLPNKQGYTEATSLPTTELTPRCQPGNVLISNIRPYFKKIVFCDTVGGCSADVLCFESKVARGEPYLFSTLYADAFFDFMVAGSKGTKMPRGDKQQIMQYPVHVPSETEVTAFGSIANPILTKMKANRIENQRLAELRDSLLPKLMAGEIDVSSIELRS